MTTSEWKSPLSFVEKIDADAENTAMIFCKYVTDWNVGLTQELNVTANELSGFRSNAT